MGTFALGFVQPAVTGIFTDIWDTGLTMSVVSPTVGINDTYDCTTNSSDIDLTTDDDDLVITCLENWSVLPTPDVEVNGEIRIFGPNGALVRYTLEIQNLSSSDITDFEVATYTNWGSDGDIWAYQNYDSAVLAVPAPDLSTNAAALQTVDSNWVVNYSDDDGSVNVDLVETNSDTFRTRTDVFTVGAGETVHLVYFNGWDPATLIELGYVQFYAATGDEDLASAAVADAAEEFDSFSGRLTRGLPADANVLNWAPAPDAEGLAATGSDNVSMWAGLALLVAGVAGRIIRRRVRA